MSNKRETVTVGQAVTDFIDKYGLPEKTKTGLIMRVIDNIEAEKIEAPAHEYKGDDYEPSRLVYLDSITNFLE